MCYLILKEGKVLDYFRFNSYLVIIASSGLMMATSVQADVDWEYNGFITQGFFESSENNFNGASSEGSFDFRELGLNASARLSEPLFLAGQVMSRTAGEVDDGKPMLDYAFLDYRVYEGLSGNAGFKIGRIKNPFGFYNETRDVAFTRPSVVLPQSIYFDKARHLELSSDGVMLYGAVDVGPGRLELELILGKPRRDLQVEYAYLNNDWQGSFSDSRGGLWKTEFSSNDYAFIGAMTFGRFELDFDVDPNAAGAILRSGEIGIDVAILSLQYNLEQWSFTTEYFLQDISWGELGGPFALIPESTSESLYVQVEHRINSEITLFGRRDLLYLDKNDRNGQLTEAKLGKPAHTQYAKDWTLGVSWEPTPDWLFIAEWHQVRGTAWLAAQDNPDTTTERWNLLALQATYRF